MDEACESRRLATSGGTRRTRAEILRELEPDAPDMSSIDMERSRKREAEAEVIKVCMSGEVASGLATKSSFGGGGGGIESCFEGTGGGRPDKYLEGRGGGGGEVARVDGGAWQSPNVILEGLNIGEGEDASKFCERGEAPPLAVPGRRTIRGRAVEVELMDLRLSVPLAVLDRESSLSCRPD